MLASSKLLVSPFVSQQTRTYVTLKEISRRLKSVKNIQKITKSMKMVSAAKYAKAERDLKLIRPFGAANLTFNAQVEVPTLENAERKKHLIIATTSDRGLCGAIHSSVVKEVKNIIKTKKDGLDTKVVLIGDKSKSMLQKIMGSSILFSVNDVGKKNVTFNDASAIANSILLSGFEYDSGEILYNRFKSAISYVTSKQPFFSTGLVTASKNYGLYDSLDADTMASFQEFQLASAIYYGLKENATSEQSARMSAMENATKNAGEMITKLTLYYNRTRQAVITRELIEIISGASALEASK